MKSYSDSKLVSWLAPEQIWRIRRAALREPLGIEHVVTPLYKPDLSHVISSIYFI